MVWGVALYLRGRPLAAGVTLGVGACAKLVSPYALLVLALVELLRLLAGRRTECARWCAMRPAGSRPALQPLWPCSSRSSM